MQGFVRGATPPSSTKRMEVFRVTTAETAQFTCCSSAIFGQWVHWFGRRSHECKQDKGECEGCRNNWPVKWKGYLHVTDPIGRNEGFLEVTATCWNLLLQQLTPQQTLRGLRFRLARTKGGAKGRYLVTVLETLATEKDLPSERDPLTTLRFLWNAKKGPSTNS